MGDYYYDHYYYHLLSPSSLVSQTKQEKAPFPRGIDSSPYFVLIRLTTTTPTTTTYYHTRSLLPSRTKEKLLFPLLLPLTLFLSGSAPSAFISEQSKV